MAFEDSFDDAEYVVKADASIKEEADGHFIGGAEDGGIGAAFLACLDCEGEAGVTVGVQLLEG